MEQTLTNDDEDKRTLLFNLLKEAPKPQLHLHLDGSLSVDFMKKSIQRMKDKHPERLETLFMFSSCENESESKTTSSEIESMLPSTDQELFEIIMVKKMKHIQNGWKQKSKGNWKVFDFCNQFLQTREDLVEATYALALKLYCQHCVNYAEIRFAPILHTLYELDEENAIQAVLDGFTMARNEINKQNGNLTFDGGVILCVLRSYPIEHAWKTLDLIEEFPEVIGFDIAGDEGSYPLEIFQDVLKTASSKGINVTVHAGEWNEIKHKTVLHNIDVALQCNVIRIGHGLALRSVSKDILEQVEKRKIFVEICLTANCGNAEKCRSFIEHPVSMMLQNGILAAGLNCDNLLLSGSLQVGAPNPTQECIRALLDCKLQPDNLLTIIENGYEAGFDFSAEQIRLQSMKLWEEKYLPEISRILHGK